MSEETREEKRLHCYLAEFDSRYGVKLGFDDLSRTAAMVKATAGKRLTY
jgi:hypothetical protein